jgi:2-haloacid dehalogenase
VAERWASFDCYGTLVDWNDGIGTELARLFGPEAREPLLRRYHELEPRVQAVEPDLAYREVLVGTLQAVAAAEGLEVPLGEADALARSLPQWQVFPDVPAALLEARARGWRLGILSNSDRDLIEASIARIGVPFDLAVVASEIGSYKPAHAHWLSFRERTGRPPDAHVAASLFHDIEPASELGIRTVWINRLDARSGRVAPDRELPDMTGLADVLDALVPG